MVKKFYNNSRFCRPQLYDSQWETFIPITISEEMVGHKLGNLLQLELWSYTGRCAAVAATDSKPAAGDKK